MANAITLAKTFIPILDKIYKRASLTSVLDGNPELVRQGAKLQRDDYPQDLHAGPRRLQPQRRLCER